MNDITIRKGTSKDYHHFSKLLLLTSPHFLPAIFGPKVKYIMQKIFRHKRHYYSFEGSFFLEVDGKIAGMALLNKKKPKGRDKLRFIFLLLRYMNWRLPLKAQALVKSEKFIKLVSDKDCYLSNIAVYPAYRSLGLGAKLLNAIEEEAKNTGKKRIILRAETWNVRAIKFYERLGYRVEQRPAVLKIRNIIFESLKIIKPVTS